MVAAEQTIRTETPDDESTVCSACFGTGLVSHWSEIAYFEDRRACPRCEAGGRIDQRIAEIIKRARLEGRFSER
jgi:DnaJ-class molecular chaperone